MEEFTLTQAEVNALLLERVQKRQPLLEGYWFPYMMLVEAGFYLQARGYKVVLCEEHKYRRNR